MIIATLLSLLFLIHLFTVFKLYGCHDYNNNKNGIPQSSPTSQASGGSSNSIAQNAVISTKKSLEYHVITVTTLGTFLWFDMSAFIGGFARLHGIYGNIMDINCLTVSLIGVYCVDRGMFVTPPSSRMNAVCGRCTVRSTCGTCSTLYGPLFLRIPTVKLKVIFATRPFAVEYTLHCTVPSTQLYRPPKKNRTVD